MIIELHSAVRNKSQTAAFGNFNLTKIIHLQLLVRNYFLRVKLLSELFF